MTGGLMQLVAYGAQDIYLTGNPMITYFKTIYRRHTNFAMEMVEQSFNGEPNFGKTVSSIISRNGDLVSNILVSADLPHLESGANKVTLRWTDHIGHHLLKSMEIEIGGQLIDKHFGDWLDIWAQLTVPAEHDKYYELIGQDPLDALGRPTGLQKDVVDKGIEGRTIYIPLQFWFCRNIGLSLPLIALQYHEVKVNIEFANIADLVRSGGIEIENIQLNARLWVEYIYLDSDERKRFANVMHEYLIDQLQYNTELVKASNSRLSPTTHNISLNFKHPVKELIWVVQPVEYVTGIDRQPSNYTSVKAHTPYNAKIVNVISGLENGLSSINDNIKLRDITNQSCVRPNGAKNPVISAKLQLNDRDRIQTMLGTYFNLVQCFEKHTSIPFSPGINVFSFALLPEKHQPSGSCNFSCIDNAKLIISIATLQRTTESPRYEYPSLGTINSINNPLCRVKVYAVNYNVLRIMSGMGGLAYCH
jgi:hypothetical protein